MNDETKIDPAVAQAVLQGFARSAGLAAIAWRGFKYPEGTVLFDGWPETDFVGSKTIDGTRFSIVRSGEIAFAVKVLTS